MRFLLLSAVFLMLSSSLFSQSGMLPEELYTVLQNKEDILILDIRTDEEYSESEKIPEAVHIPFRKLAMELKARGLEYNKRIVVYDRTGNIGRIAVSFLQKMLYTNVRYLMGGYLAWQDNMKKMESNIPAYEEVPFAATNNMVKDSLNHEISVDSMLAGSKGD